MFNIKDEGFSKRKKWVWLPIIAAVGLLILLSIQNIDMPVRDLHGIVSKAKCNR